MTACEHEFGSGAELYNEIGRLICEWNGSDAADRTRKLPELVDALARLRVGFTAASVNIAAHDHAEAA